MNFKTKTTEYKRNVKVSKENYPRISKDEIEAIERMFKKIDKKNIGYITSNDLLDVLRKLGHYISDAMKKKIKTELASREIEKIDLFILYDLVNAIRMWMDEEEDDLESEYIDAFVSMGGRRDKSGTVKKETIIDLIKNEFELTFDIEQLLDRFGVNREELDFQSFCILFENTGNKDSASKKKDIMGKNEKANAKTLFNKTFVGKFEDYEKFLIREQDKARLFF